MAQLQSILATKEVGGYEFRLGDQDRSRWIEMVSPRLPAGHDWEGLRDPYTDTDDVEFSKFAAAWVRLHKEAPGVAASVDPGYQHTFVTSLFIDACNAAETLATRLAGDAKAGPTDEDRHIITILAAGRVARSTRRGIKAYLRQRRWSLQAKLELLASRLGPQSAAWLIGPFSSDWAYLLARLRNAIAHGGALPGGLDKDPAFLIAAKESLHAVITLAMLEACGYSNHLAPAANELLWSSGITMVSHPNSELFRKLEWVASGSPRWAAWKQVLDKAGVEG